MTKSYLLAFLKYTESYLPHHILTQGEDLPVSAPAKVINDRTLVGIRDLADCIHWSSPIKR